MHAPLVALFSAVLAAGGVQGVAVDVADHADRLNVAARATLNAGVDDVAAVLVDIARFPAWMPGITEWDVLERADDHVVVHGLHDLPFPFASRDYVVRYTWARGDDGSFTLAAASTKGAPPARGVVRLDDVASRWRVTPAGAGKVVVEYAAQGDIGDKLASGVRAKASKAEAAKLVARIGAEVERRAQPGR